MKVSFEEPNKVRIHWEYDIDHQTSEWNEGCAYAVKHFGLPGERFTTEITENWMLFSFFNPNDAMMFLLGVS